MSKRKNLFRTSELVHFLESPYIMSTGLPSKDETSEKTTQFLKLKKSFQDNIEGRRVNLILEYYTDSRSPLQSHPL